MKMHILENYNVTDDGIEMTFTPEFAELFRQACANGYDPHKEAERHEAMERLGFDATTIMEDTFRRMFYYANLSNKGDEQ